MASSGLAIHVLALLAGIVAGDACPPLSPAGLWGAPLLLLAAVLLRRAERSALWLAALGCALAGTALPARWTGPLPPSALARALPAPPGKSGRTALSGVIARPPLPGPGSTRLTLAVRGISRDGCRRRAGGRVRVYVGGETPELRAGDRVRLQARLRPPRRYRNPGAADRPRALARRGIRWVATVPHPEEIVLLERPGGSGRVLGAARRRLAGLLRGAAPGEAPLLEALLLGDRGRIAPPVRDAFARAGVAHVLAVSGLHIAMVALTTGALCLRLLGLIPRLLAGGAARRIAIGAGAAAAWAYALLAGGAEPALRAALMATAVSAALLARRRVNGWNALLLAALLLVLGKPARVFAPGVQLSFLSVAGLIACWGGRQREGEGRSAAIRAAARRACEMMLVTGVATFATLPVQASVFGRVSLVAPLGNIIVVPLLGSVAVPCLLGASAISAVSAEAADAGVRIAALAAHGARAWAGWLASWDGAVVDMAPLDPLALLAWLALALSLPFLFGKAGAGKARPSARRRAAGLALLGLLAIAGDAVIWAGRLRPPASLRLRVLDVGQGDATLLETPEGARILVDAGPAYALPGGRRFDAGERVVAPALRALRIRALDVLAVTHPDADHAGGAPAILAHFAVGEVWIPAGAARAGGLRELLADAGRRRIPVVPLARGAPPRVRGRTRIEILGPPPPGENQPLRGPVSGRNAASDSPWNDRSLVLRIVTPGLRVLLPGDIEAAGEAALLRAGRPLRAEILKVPHHGSDTSSTPAFLAAVRPRVALISAGAGNRFGFPAPAALARLRAAGARIRRTDLAGALTVPETGDGPAPGPKPVTPGLSPNSLNPPSKRAVKERDPAYCSEDTGGGEF